MKIIRLLTIGNSFSQNALTYLEDIAASGGEVAFEVGRASLGGCSLEKHWNLAEYTRRQPDYKTYNLHGGQEAEPQMANLQDALADRPWDVVTLQQVSRQSWRRETFQPYLDNLLGLVNQLAPQAETLLHQTWAYRTDSPYLAENGLSQRIMHERIAANYRHWNTETGCRVLPSGEAVQRARETEGRRFTWPDPDFDYRDPATAPALPNQDHSLIAGWFWAINNAPTGIPELRNDSIHLNAAGCYLIGCVWYEALTGLDATAIDFAPEDLNAETAAWLRRTAHETVAAFDLC